MKKTITTKSMNEFQSWLNSEDHSTGTIEKYMRDLKRLAAWLNGKKVTKESLTEWKEHLIENGYEPVTINSMLAAVNTYCNFAELNIKIKFLRIQRRVFRDESKNLSKSEYKKLIQAAESKGNARLSMLIETIGATGIRVSEVKYITVSTAQKGYAQIILKGKVRDILIPHKLCKKLLKYAKKQKIASGEIFITKSGKGLSRKQIWSEMKSLCKSAGVEASKVFPHNLRHLFAQVFYHTTHDVAKLADILGHSSIETTRIYLLSSGMEHAKQLEALGLIQ